MSAEYRFLRFESVGLATIIFLVLGLFPLFHTALMNLIRNDVGTAIAGVAGLFLLSLPIGYIEHQFVVNVYRSPKKSRRVHKIFNDLVLEAQNLYKGSSKERPFFNKFNDKSRISFLAILLDLFIYSKKSVADFSIFTRLSDRWSHFYARRAVGKYAPLIAFSLFIVFIIFGWIMGWPIDVSVNNIAVSGLLWIVFFVVGIFVVDSYSEKIWLEISHLETAIVLAELEEIKPVLEKIVFSLIEHPDYIERGGSYGIAIYKL